MLELKGNQVKSVPISILWLQPSADVRGAEGVVPLAVPAAHCLAEEPPAASASVKRRHCLHLALRAAVPRPHLQDHDGRRARHQGLGLVPGGGCSM